MQIAGLNKKQTTKLFYSLVGLVLVFFFLTSKQTDPGVFAAGILLGFLSLYPLYFWLLGWSHGLPIWPIFCLVTGVTAALPMVQAPASLNVYTPGEVITGGMTISGFIMCGTFIWVLMTSQPPRPPRKVLMIGAQHAKTYLFAFVAAGLFFQLNQNLRIVELPGNMMQIARGVSMSLNTMGLFVLSFYLGQDLLSKRATFWLITMGVMTALGAAAGMLLASLMVPVAMMLFGYMLGSGRVPWLGFAAAIVGLALLHPGKFIMREKVWYEGQTPTLVGLPAFYAEWIGYSLEEVGSVAGLFKTTSQEGERSTVFERGGSLHMLLLVQKASPNEVPFQNGITYEHIPRMLVPRFLDDQKGTSHAGNIILSVNYGLLLPESVGGVSIQWGLIPEAYANFGYTGVFCLAIALAVFYSLAARAVVGVPMTSLRFVLGLLFMAAATQADTMGIFVTSQFQGVAGITLAALVLMRWQANPFAAEAANGGLQDYGMTGRGGLPRIADDSSKRGPEGTPQSVGPTKWGGQKPPKWAPLAHRKAFELAAARRNKAETATDAADEKNADEGKAQRPRQVAVPIQPYYYRSRKA